MQDSEGSDTSELDDTGDTETVEGEVTEVEVTRVITETVVETVEVEAGSEDDEDIFEEEPEPPLATGSEDDSGPLPPEPEDGPKVTSRGGAPVENSSLEATVSETAVPRRANPTQNSQLEGPILIAVANTEVTNEWLKMCDLVEELRKKRCS
ncbi:MAG: hypothetical protein DHS20C20_19570 [Ardenticatenaceae bacterium]|nr:MAG: hypothetical protein DHS20C20_19570 [Ardenticatenaceae bacterium]